MWRIDPQSDSYSALMWDVITNAHRYIPKSGDAVLDLGAHFGMFSLYCAARGCGVWSYEPTPETFRELQHSSEVAKEIGLGVISPVQAAVCQNEGTVTIWRCPETSGANRIKRVGNEQGVLARAVTLHHAMEPYEKWDCVKVDIEGAEYEVLMNASSEDLERIRFLTMEVHNDILKAEEVEELVNRLTREFPISAKIEVHSQICTLLCSR